ncbi:MAG: hypothetical protein LCH37_15345 [Bacteroidetes bacterium]|nr:hypothetical protein [Bacteroidota bacterium]
MKSSKEIDRKFKTELAQLLDKYEAIGLEKNTINSVEEMEISSAVVLIVKYLRLNGGSIGDFDLYKLLNVYFRFPEKRKKINNILSEKH